MNLFDELETDYRPSSIAQRANAHLTNLREDPKKSEVNYPATHPLLLGAAMESCAAGYFPAGMSRAVQDKFSDVYRAMVDAINAERSVINQVNRLTNG